MKHFYVDVDDIQVGDTIQVLGVARKVSGWTRYQSGIRKIYFSTEEGDKYVFRSRSDRLVVGRRA